MIDVVELLQHWHAGRPKSVVASSLGIDPKTVRKDVAKATEAGLCPGGPALGRAEWAELVRGWFPELTRIPTGTPVGTAEEALDSGCGLYLDAYNT